VCDWKIGAFVSLAAAKLGELKLME